MGGRSPLSHDGTKPARAVPAGRSVAAGSYVNPPRAVSAAPPAVSQATDGANPTSAVPAGPPVVLLAGGGAELGPDLRPGAAEVAPGRLLVVPDGHVQPELGGARRPQLLPVALRHPGHLDPRTLVPPGPAPPCPGSLVVQRSPDHGFLELICSSSRILFGFIMKFRRLGRVSWPCRSRYATSAAQSRSTGLRTRQVGGPPDAPIRLSAPPRGVAMPRRVT